MAPFFCRVLYYHKREQISLVVLLQLFSHHNAKPDQTGNKDQHLFILHKMGLPRPLFNLFSSLQTNISILTQQNYVKKCYVHPVYGVGIRAHNLRNMSLLPKPLDNFFIYFRLFKQTILTTNIREKMLWPSSIWCQDLNLRPLEHESPPITTRPVANLLTTLQS